LFAQQMAPVAFPQVVHVPALQIEFVAQFEFSATHVVPPDAQHPLFWHLGAAAQHVPPCAPHGVTHVPLVHVPPLIGQAVLFATQVAPSQQPPLAQAAAGARQHAWVAPPHITHDPPTHVPPLPHRSPEATQSPDVVSQHPPPWQELPAQHTLPEVPHAWQTFWPQTSPEVEHAA
jgi:hypothetical protein